MEPLHMLHVLKDGDTFVVADSHGDIGGHGDGLFHEDTRLLSELRFEVAGQRPALLSSAVSAENMFFTAHLTNQPLPELGADGTPRGIVHIERKRFLRDERMFERLRLCNYGDDPVQMPLGLYFRADFRDMFEVRGQQRERRGELLPARIGRHGVEQRYRGLDDLVRRLAIVFSRRPDRLLADRAEFDLRLPGRASWILYLEAGATPARPRQARWRRLSVDGRCALRLRRRRGTRIVASGRLFQSWLDKSRADLALLTTEMPTGPYPYAGIPWFATAFGRDAIITALQTLWLDPSLARGVLAFLAEHQACATSSFRDAEPGKIMHETRRGEMSQLDELPFGRYYGGVDTTPLFLILAGAYARRIGDRAFIDHLWPSLLAAAGWLEHRVDESPNGFVDYARAAATGLANQGWKDSGDSVFHADGSLALGPIAMVEVQGYAWRAWCDMAELAEWRGETHTAARWRERARRMREAVEQRFWLQDLGFYALALDGEGAPCRVRASNPGHLLYTGLPMRARALSVSRVLASRAFSGGWGIRTVAGDSVRFNPMSYHNGSIWPHDTALCVAGMARYGERDHVMRVAGEMFEAAVHYGMRLPELFCGFNRSPGAAPVAYPVACLPQAWASGSVFMLLQACLGIEIDAIASTISIERPRLPPGLDHLRLDRLELGERHIALDFRRIDHQVVVSTDQPPDQEPIAVVLRP